MVRNHTVIIIVSWDDSQPSETPQRHISNTDRMMEVTHLPNLDIPTLIGSPSLQILSPAPSSSAFSASPSSHPFLFFLSSLCASLLIASSCYRFPFLPFSRSYFYSSLGVAFTLIHSYHSYSYPSGVAFSLILIFLALLFLLFLSLLILLFFFILFRGKTAVSSR